MLNDTRRQIDNVINWRKSINEELNNSELLNERWYHGSYDAREIEKEGGFTRKNMRVRYIKDYELYKERQKEMDDARENNYMELYHKLIDNSSDLCDGA